MKIESKMEIIQAQNREISIWAFKVVERLINRTIRQSFVRIFIEVI